MIPLFDIQNRFKTDKNYRDGRDQVVDYFSYEESPLQKEGLTFMSGILDRSFQKSYIEIAELIQNSQEHRQRIQELEKQPRLVGKNSYDTRILDGSSEFEQMLALNEFIPVKVNPVAQISKKMMNVYLGSTKGDHKAPKYEEWAKNDPRFNPYQEIFMKPLFGLEAVRQPQYLGSSILKGHSFLTDHVNEDWRFGTKTDEVYSDGIRDTHMRTACVELKNQSGHEILKNQSAGYNLMKLVEEISDEDENICIEPVFEEFIDDQDIEDLQIDIAPKRILEAVEVSVLHHDDSTLDEITSLMFALKLGPSTTPVVREYVANKILDYTA